MICNCELDCQDQGTAKIQPASASRASSSANAGAVDTSSVVFRIHDLHGAIEATQDAKGYVFEPGNRNAIGTPMCFIVVPCVCMWVCMWLFQFLEFKLCLTIMFWLLDMLVVCFSFSLFG